MTPARSALILGATGQTGQVLLQGLLLSPFYSVTGEFGRHITPLDKILQGQDKLKQFTIDFERLHDSKLKDEKWDNVFITLGTTRKAAGSEANFERIDRDYVINAAKQAKSPEPKNTQRLIYLSSAGANSSSPFLYPKSKGLTEEGLARLGYSDTIVFRPGFLAGTNRSERRMAESLFGKVTGALSYVTDSIQIEITTLAKAMGVAGRMGSDALPPAVGATKVKLDDGTSYTVIGNAGAIALAKLS